MLDPTIVHGQPRRELVMLHIGDSPNDEEGSIVRPAFIDKPVSDLIKARDAGCAKLGTRWHALCGSGAHLSIEVADRLKVEGFETADLPHTKAPRALDAIDEDTSPRMVAMTVPLFLDLFVFVCRLGDPTLSITVPDPYYIALGGGGLLSTGYLEIEVEANGDDSESHEDEDAEEVEE